MGRGTRAQVTSNDVRALLRGRPAARGDLPAWDHQGRNDRLAEQYAQERAQRRRALLEQPEPPDPYGSDRGQFNALSAAETDALNRVWQEWASAHVAHLIETRYPVAAAPADAATSQWKNYGRDLAKELRARSGKSWSVRGSRGTGAGWYRIGAPPVRRVDGYMSTQDRIELAALLGLDKPVHPQGQQVMAQRASHDEFLDRARGYAPRSFGQANWD